MSASIIEIRNRANPVTIVMGATSGAIVSATAVTGAPGTDAAVTLGGTPAARTIEFTIPAGAAGTNATITSATAVTGDPGTAAAVTLGGTPSARTIEFTIPAGEAATVNVGTVTVGEAGSQPTVVNSGDSKDAVLDFTFPAAETPDIGTAAGYDVGTTEGTIPLLATNGNLVLAGALTVGADMPFTSSGARVYGAGSTFTYAGTDESDAHLTALGGGAVGGQLFKAATVAAARSIIGMGRGRAVMIANDFYSGNSTAGDVSFATIGSGSFAQSTALSTANHPGNVLFFDSTTANGGARISTSKLVTFMLAGGEIVSAVFQVSSARTTQSIRIGFDDSASVEAPTDGVWISMVGNGSGFVVAGNTASNAITSTTATTYTAAINTWYACVIEVVSTSLARFSLLSEAGAVLWTDTLAANIPNGNGRNTALSVIATESTTDTGVVMLALDYLSLEINRELIR